MKKILTVSLVAIMAVSAARADIASVKYVDDSIKPVSESVATKAEAADLQALTTTVSDMDAAYKLADQGINTELAKKIDKTEVESTYATKQEVTDLDVTALTNRVSANETAISAMDAAYKAADDAINADLAKKIDATAVESTYATQATVNAMDAAYKAADDAINADLAKKANSADVYTKLESDAKYQLTFGDSASCTLNGTFECAAVVGTDGALAWKRIIDSAEQKATSAANAY